MCSLLDAGSVSVGSERGVFHRCYDDWLLSGQVGETPAGLLKITHRFRQYSGSPTLLESFFTPNAQRDYLLPPALMVVAFIILDFLQLL